MPLRIRLLVIRNPVAGLRRGRLFEKVMRRLTDTGCRITLRETWQRGDAELYARAATPLEFDAVVAAGGDGTINEVANGLAGRNVALAILPLGTANVLATEIGLPVRAKAIARTILRGQDRAIRVGLVNGRRFTLMAGVGFDAHVVRRVTPWLKRRLGRNAYVLESLREILRHRGLRYPISLDGRPTDAASLIVANGRHYAGPYVAAPNASLTDDSLHAVQFLRDGRWNCIRYGLALLRNRFGSMPDIRIDPVQTVEIQEPAGEPVQGDGDIIAVLPARISLDPEPLRLIVPRRSPLQRREDSARR
ncbi:MAG: diacylglycerol kinase family protein [Alphaproteobacteria bacterium]